MNVPEDLKPAITEIFEHLLTKSKEQYYVLRLCIAGSKF